MADAKPVRLLPLVLIAGLVTLLVTGVRLWGELAGWDAQWFNREAGSPLNPFGIVWLVPCFGMLFGRRAAQMGSRPPFVAAFFVPMFGFAACMAAGMLIYKEVPADKLLTTVHWYYAGSATVALLALFAWPRLFVATLGYGVLARLPVLLVQYLDVQNGWQTHYGKVHEKFASLNATGRLELLSLAQVAAWIPFTILLGTGFAALGAATVRAK